MRTPSLLSKQQRLSSKKTKTMVLVWLLSTCVLGPILLKSPVIQTRYKLIKTFLNHDRSMRYDSICAIISQSDLPGYFHTILPALAIVESGLDSDARSNSGAQGVWQLMPATARHYGLTINDCYDARTDLTQATRAVIHHITMLIQTIESSPHYKSITLFLDDQRIPWDKESLLYPLVIVAYHAGQGHVARMLSSYLEYLYRNRGAVVGSTSEDFLSRMIQWYAQTPSAQIGFSAKFGSASELYLTKVTMTAKGLSQTNMIRIIKCYFPNVIFYILSVYPN